MMLAGFYCLQLDRGNISVSLLSRSPHIPYLLLLTIQGNAITGTLFQDVGINQDQLNNGQTILLLMIVLFEIPSNIILARLGAKWWLSCQSKLPSLILCHLTFIWFSV